MAKNKIYTKETPHEFCKKSASVAFKNLDNVSRKQINISKVRGSVRLMSGKIKTASDVKAMKKAFNDLKIP